MNEPEVFLDLDRIPSLATCSFRRFDPGEYHVTRVSDCDVLLLMLEGELIFYEDGKRISLLPGQWYIQRAGLSQTGGEPSLLPYYYYIHFHGDFSPEPRHPLPLAGRFEPGDFLPLLQRLDTAWWTDGSGVSRQSAFFDIFAKLEDAVPANPVTGMIAYLSEHLGEELHLSDLAREFRYTEDHIIRLFRRWKGITPHRCILELRLRKARQLLETTDRDIAAIAAQTGFADPSVFYRAFRRDTGLSPGEWRRLRSGVSQ